MGDPVDDADMKWLNFHSRIWRQLQEGTQWWGREGFNGEYKDNVPRMHILDTLTRVGEHGDALYQSRCGYKFRFKRVFLEKPKAPNKPPHTLLRCLNCLAVVKESSDG